MSELIVTDDGASKSFATQRSDVDGDIMIYELHYGIEQGLPRDPRDVELDMEWAINCAERSKRLRLLDVAGKNPQMVVRHEA